jgi:hypothetical protein
VPRTCTAPPGSKQEIDDLAIRGSLARADKWSEQPCSESLAPNRSRVKTRAMRERGQESFAVYWRFTEGFGAGDLRPTEAILELL